MTFCDTSQMRASAPPFRSRGYLAFFIGPRGEAEDGFISRIAPDGKLLVASQIGHNVYGLDLATGRSEALAENIEVPAAIGFDARRGRLPVPQIRAGSLSIYEVSR